MRQTWFIGQKVEWIPSESDWLTRSHGVGPFVVASVRVEQNPTCTCKAPKTAHHECYCRLVNPQMVKLEGIDGEFSAELLESVEKPAVTLRGTQEVTPQRTKTGENS